MGRDATFDSAAEVIEVLEAGEEVPEGALVRHLRSPSCPRELVERLAGCRWVRRLRRAPVLLLRHPACPRTFAWEVIARLGWHDIARVLRDPRTAPAIRTAGERKLCERLPQLTVGERSALARQATRGVIAALLADESPVCVQAMLDNPHFTEADAVRLIATNANPACVVAVLRHRRWNASRAVTDAAVRSPRVPLGVALGIVATLSARQLCDLAKASDVAAAIRDSARSLGENRSRARGRTAEDG